MIDQALAIIAPHHCYGCDDSGSILCQCCKNYIQDEAFSGCVICYQATGGDNLCTRHHLPYSRLWCITERQGAMTQALDAYKFQRARSGFQVFAELLDDSLPELPPETVVVPVTTAPKNVRLRGYDHIELIARRFARLRRLEVCKLLARKNNLTQHFAKNLAQRRRQAAGFFEIRGEVDEKLPHLLIDDIFTTGSTIKAAADCMAEAGISEVWVAVITRQIDQKLKASKLKP